MPVVAVIAAGAMGGAIGKRLTSAGCTVLTNLIGRSEATRRRALDAGMKDATYAEIAQTATYVLSIMPPSEAYGFAKAFISEAASTKREDKLIFADCNAINPQSMKRLAGLLAESTLPFPVLTIDASIIGGPPSDGYDPTIYASADNSDALADFAKLSDFGLKISLLDGEGVGVGDASALKMSYAGITKGTTALFAQMILAAHASSPATAQALLKELRVSQKEFLTRITRVIPPMLPKAYRWAGEMEEISGFIGEDDLVYQGISKVYERVERSVKGNGEDAQVLLKFVEDAKAT